MGVPRPSSRRLRRRVVSSKSIFVDAKPQDAYSDLSPAIALVKGQLSESVDEISSGLIGNFFNLFF